MYYKRIHKFFFKKKFNESILLLLDFLKNRLKKAVEGFRLGTPGLRETLGTLSSPRDRLCTFVRLRLRRFAFGASPSAKRSACFAFGEWRRREAYLSHLWCIGARVLHHRCIHKCCFQQHESSPKAKRGHLSLHVTEGELSYTAFARYIRREAKRDESASRENRRRTPVLLSVKETVGLLTRAPMHQRCERCARGEL